MMGGDPDALTLKGASGLSYRYWLLGPGAPLINGFALGQMRTFWK